jgi:hypothetical protein
MAYQKKGNDFKQTVFSNTAEKVFVQVKKFYAVILVDGVEKLYRYDCKFRVEAIAMFDEYARLDHGKVLMIGTLK